MAPAGVSAEDDQRLHRLFCPGRLLHLRPASPPVAPAPSGKPPQLELVQSAGGPPENKFQRLLLKRTMLTDHFLAA